MSFSPEHCNFERKMLDVDKLEVCALEEVTTQGGGGAQLEGTCSGLFFIDVLL